MSNFLHYLNLNLGFTKSFDLAFGKTIGKVFLSAVVLAILSSLGILAGVEILNAFAGRAHAQEAVREAKKISIRQEQYVEKLQDFVAGCVSGQPFLYMEDDKAYVCISKRYAK